MLNGVAVLFPVIQGGDGVANGQRYFHYSTQRVDYFYSAMNEPFELPVSFTVEEMLFPAQLQQFGYTHLFVVDVYGLEMFFEQDEELAHRAI